MDNRFNVLLAEAKALREKMMDFQDVLEDRDVVAGPDLSDLRWAVGAMNEVVDCLGLHAEPEESDD